MASKKKISKKKSAVKKKKPGKALATMDSYRSELAEMAQKESSRIKGGEANRLSTKGSEFSFKGSDLGEELDVVVLGFTYENAYYDGPYDEDNLSTPACFSIDVEQDDMVPHTDSPDPQGKDCASCEQNEWGSDARGKGKACGNHRRIAMIALADLDNENPEDIEIAVLRTAPTTNKNFDKFVKGVAKLHKLPPLGVICQMSFDEEFDYPVVVFKTVNIIDNVSHMQLVMEKREEAIEMLNEGYDPSSYTSGKSSSKKPSNKKAKKKAKKKSKFRK